MPLNVPGCPWMVNLVNGSGQEISTDLLFGAVGVRLEP